MATLVDTKGKPVAAPVQEADDWMDTAADIDQATVETEGSLYPFCQWIYGKPGERRGGGIPYTGGWFIPADQLDGEPQGWEKGTLDHMDGSATDGFFRRDIEIALVHMRRRWVATNKATKETRVFPWDAYDQASEFGRAAGRTHILVYIRGLEECGPFILTMSSSGGKAFVGSRKEEGVIGRFKRMVIAPANSLNKKRGVKALWPYRAFWLQVGPKRKGDGAPEFDTAGQGTDAVQVTVPVLIGAHEKMSEAEIRALFVGRDLLMEMTEQYTATDPWARAWDEIEPGSPMESPEHRGDNGNGNGNGNGHNGNGNGQQPEPSNEELPF